MLMATDPITVSMYNVGFGDCFLLRFPGDDGERRVLIDCGSIKQGEAGGTDVIVPQIIEDVTDDDGVARIDVVAISHRHKDHVSGFGNEAWREVEVREVWLPWTEDPDDPEARRLLNEMASFALALEAEVASFGAFSAAEQDLIDHVIENSFGLSNEAAMATLHRGFAKGTHGATRKFLSRTLEPSPCIDTLPDADVLPGVTVHQLGPSRDEEVIRDMNPPSEESFLRAAPGGGASSFELLPFDVESEPPLRPSEKITDLLQRISHETALMGAVALEKAVNNTSLMLAFEVGEAVLFFPGDAQWGAWKINLEDDRVAELLKRTTFYKVGHHGSHNSTPVTFVEDVLEPADAQSVFAAASVVPHGRFKEIPKQELVHELEARLGDPDRLIRSDEAPADADTPEGVTVIRKDAKVIRIDFEVPVV